MNRFAILFLILSVAFYGCKRTAADVQGSGWPEWSLKFFGDGWNVLDADDAELIKIAENNSHDVGIFVSGRPFPGNFADMLATAKSTMGPSNQSTVSQTKINGEAAVELIGSFQKGGQAINGWALMFLRDKKLMVVQGLYKDETGRKFLEPTMKSFRFTR